MLTAAQHDRPSSMREATSGNRVPLSGALQATPRRDHDKLQEAAQSGVAAVTLDEALDRIIDQICPCCGERTEQHADLDDDGDWHFYEQCVGPAQHVWPIRPIGGDQYEPDRDLVEHNLEVYTCENPR